LKYFSKNANCLIYVFEFIYVLDIKLKLLSKRTQIKGRQMIVMNSSFVFILKLFSHAIKIILPNKEKDLVNEKQRLIYGPVINKRQINNWQTRHTFQSSSASSKSEGTFQEESLIKTLKREANNESSCIFTLTSSLMWLWMKNLWLDVGEFLRLIVFYYCDIMEWSCRVTKRD
jgi:hypothetical protein